MKNRVLRARLGRLGAVALGMAACVPAWSQSPTLRETVVTATRLPDASQALPMGVAVVTAEQIRDSGATTINEALVRLLGIVGRQDLNGGGNLALDLRGFGDTADSNQVVVLDGMRLSEADLSSPQLAAIPIDSVERIEVLRGSGSVLYGEGATAGVIVITTQAGSGRQRRSGASVYGAAGSHGLRDGRASGTFAQGGFSIDASLQRRLSDGWRANSRSDSDAQSVGLQWANGWLRAGVSTARDGLDARLPGPLSVPAFTADPRGIDPAYANDRIHMDGERHNAFMQAELGAWQLRADLGTRKRAVRSTTSGLRYDFDIDSDTLNLRARHDARVMGLSNVLQFGVDHGRWQREVDGAFGPGTASQRTEGVYVRDDLTLAGGTRLAAGLRSERLRKDSANAFSSAALRERVPAWELGLSHPVAADTVAYARLGTSFRLGNLDEIGFTAGGVMLRPQRSRDAEVGVRWGRGGHSLELRAWNSRLRDEIGYDDLAFANANLAPTRRQGIEFDANWRWTPAVSTRLAAAIRRASFRDGAYAGNDIALVPERTLSLRAQWAAAPGHRLSGGATWVDSQYADAANLYRLPSYAVADVRYTYAWRQAEFSLAVNNLLDKRYYSRGYLAWTGDLAVYPETARSLTAAVRMTF